MTIEIVSHERPSEELRKENEYLWYAVVILFALLAF